MNKPFDPTKPVQTRDGRKATILVTDLLGDFPIVARILNSQSQEFVNSYTKNGTFYMAAGGATQDLVNIPEEPKKGWVNIYEDGRIFNHPTRSHADDAGRASGKEQRIACIKIEYHEGQGLN